MSLKKIVVIGPESTGKSFLCEKLAAHYKTTWVKEYAREYLLQHGSDYNFADLLSIAKGQLELETKGEADINTGTTLFIDTNMYVMKVWCEFVFNQTHNWILDKIVERPYDLYLLCNPDLPWVKDELREYPDLINRLKLYHIYRDAMINQKVPWVEIRGDYDQRFEIAREAVDSISRKAAK